MIYLYTGTPGSGKSLDALVSIRSRVRRHKPVMCNFPVSLTGVDVVEDISCEDVISWSVMHKPDTYRDSYGLIVIDEAQLVLNSRFWQATDRKYWNTFFSQHRKFGVDVILVSQSDILIDKQIRCLIEYEVMHRRALSVFGVTFVDLFVAETFYYGKSRRVGARFFVGGSSLYKLYDTSDLFGSISSV